MENKIADSITKSDGNNTNKYITKADEKEEMMQLARFLYSIYKNNPELVKSVSGNKK